MKFTEEDKEKFEQAAAEIGANVAHFTASVATMIRGFVHFVSKTVPPPLALTCFETFKEDMDGLLDETCKELKSEIDTVRGMLDKMEASEEDLGIEDDE